MIENTRSFIIDTKMMKMFFYSIVHIRCGHDCSILPMSMTYRLRYKHFANIIGTFQHSSWNISSIVKIQTIPEPKRKESQMKLNPDNVTLRPFMTCLLIVAVIVQRCTNNLGLTAIEKIANPV